MLARLTQLTAGLHRSAWALPLAALVAVLMIVISELAYHQAEAGLNSLVVMGKMRLELTQVVRRATDAESGQRGYLLTSRVEYLEPYRNASLEVQQGLQRLQSFYRSVGDQDSGALLARMAADLRTKLSELDTVMTIHDGGRVEAALELMRSGIGRDLMVNIRQRSDDLLARENQRIETGLNKVFDTLLLSRFGVAALTLISLLLLGLYLRKRRQLDAQVDVQRDHERAERERLETEVRVRTAELTALARHLETAREDERARLARDLHDELGALLTAAKLEVARIRPKLLGVAPELTPRLASLVDMLNSGIALKRRIIEDLRPSTLDTLGLAQALELLCGEFAERLAVPVLTRIATVALAPTAQLTVFRFVQESLTNIAKHAHASEVRVTLEQRDDTACVTVQDNGVGFDAQQRILATHGLLGMRLRIEAEGGEFELQSTPGQGTTLCARLPPTVGGVTAAN